MATTYAHGTVTVGIAAALLVTVSAQNDGVLIQNQGPGVLYLGGPGVTADTAATAGLKVAVNATQTVPSVGGRTEDIYAISSVASTLVTYLQPV
jgi:hypothetical protein